MFQAGSATATNGVLPPLDPEILVEDARTISSGALLSDAELKRLIVKAETGDEISAFKLYSHFVSKEEYLRSKYWLIYAAARGHPVAQYNMWFDLKDSADCQGRLNALAWLTSASLSGNELAIKYLAVYRKTVLTCLEVK